MRNPERRPTTSRSISESNDGRANHGIMMLVLLRTRSSCALRCAGLWLTQRAGLLVGESCLQWMPWMRCLCTSSSADGSVHKWSAVFIFVYSSAQGPTGEMKGTSYINAPTPPPQRCTDGDAGVHFCRGFSIFLTEAEKNPRIADSLQDLSREAAFMQRLW